MVINDDFSNIEVLSIVSDEKKKTQYSLAQQKIEIIVTPKEKNPAHQAEKTGTPRIKKSVPVHSSKQGSARLNRIGKTIHFFREAHRSDLIPFF